jgi:hypothetical protein
MSLRHWSSFSAALLVVFGGLRASAGPESTPSKEAPRFEKLKALVGRWETADGDKDGKPDQVAIYRLTGAGTAVQETLFPDTPKEMVTLYTLDGDDLVMTHYCSLGNQPHMQAAPGAADGKIAFAYVNGGNLKSRDTLHMDALALTLTDATHLKHDWTLWKDGKALQTISFDFTRSK